MVPVSTGPNQLLSTQMQPQPTPEQAPPYVSAVRTQDPDGGETRWTAVEFVSAVRSGEQFVAMGADEQRAALEPAVCLRCPTVTITIDGEVSVDDCRDPA